MGQACGPDPLQIGGMDQMPGKVGPGVGLDEELRELHPGETLGNPVSEGIGTRRSRARLQRCQHEVVLLDPQVTVLARQEPFDLGRRSQSRFRARGGAPAPGSASRFGARPLAANEATRQAE
jgi:hypothetical protein